MEPARLLIADDDETFLRSTAELLRREGYECDIALEANTASDLLRKNNYQALITDLRMPGNMAMEFLESNKDRFTEVPLIIVTGYPSVSTAVTSLRLAAVDYITKPVDFSELLKSVRKAVDRSRGTESAKRFFSELRSWLDRVPPSLAMAGAPKPVAAALPTVPDPLQKLEGLSPREREIVGAVLSGKRVAAVARTLDISPHTVRNHLKSIFRKLGVHSQVELLGRLR